MGGLHCGDGDHGMGCLESWSDGALQRSGHNSHHLCTIVLSFTQQTISSQLRLHDKDLHDNLRLRAILAQSRVLHLQMRKTVARLQVAVKPGPRWPRPLPDRGSPAVPGGPCQPWQGVPAPPHPGLPKGLLLMKRMKPR